MNGKGKCLAAAALIGGAGLVHAAGTGAAGGEQREFAEDATFTIAVLNDLGSLNPYVERQNFGFGLSTYLYDSLVYIDLDGEVTSNLAEDWETTPSSAVFTLRDDVTCSNGDPLTASHVAEVIAWNSDPDSGSSQYGLRTSTRATTSVEADDEANTVSIELDGDDGTFLERIGILPIVCPTGFENQDSLATESDGTGPYVLESASPERVTFTIREGYTWGPDGATTDEPGMPQTVEIRVIPDESTHANLLLSGDINVGRVTGPDRERLDAAGIEAYDQALPGTWLAFNHQEERVTNDFAIREALIAAVDIDQVIETSTAGRGEEPTSLLALAPWTCAGDTPVSELVPDYDPDAARQILDDAGWEETGNGGRERDGEPLAIRVVYSENDHALNRVSAELYGSYWEAVGFDVTLASAEGADLYDLIYVTSNFDVVMTGWSFNLPSTLMPFLSGAMPPNGTNAGHLTNETYETLADEALTMTVPEACDTWQAAERAIIEDLGVVPVSNRTAGWYFSSSEGDVLAYNQIAPTTVRVYED